MHKTRTPFDKLQSPRKYFGVHFCMRSFDKLFLGFAILLYTSCAEETSNTVPDSTAIDSSLTQESKVDTVQEVAADVSNTVSRPYPEILLNWEKELQMRGVNFDLDNFYAAAQHDFDFGYSNPWDREVPSYFTPSPDTSYYTYTVPNWIGGEPDSYLFLIDVKKGLSFSLDVVGTCASFEDSGWKNDHILVAYGYDDCTTDVKFPGKGLYQGFYCFYNFKTKIETVYCSKNYFNPKWGR